MTASRGDLVAAEVAVLEFPSGCGGRVGNSSVSCTSHLKNPRCEPVATNQSCSQRLSRGRVGVDQIRMLVAGYRCWLGMSIFSHGWTAGQPPQRSLKAFLPMSVTGHPRPSNVADVGVISGEVVRPQHPADLGRSGGRSLRGVRASSVPASTGAGIEASHQGRCWWR